MSLAKMVALCGDAAGRKGSDVKAMEEKMVYNWFRSLSLEERSRILAVTDPIIISLFIRMSHFCRDHQKRPRLGHRLRSLKQPTFFVFPEMLRRPDSRQRPGSK